MSQAASYRGPDGIDTWHHQNVGLTQLLMATTPEAVAESKPLFHNPSQTCIVFDGRLDNGSELRRQLRPGQLESNSKSDMELVLQSWLKWGLDCPSHLLGDFAFAVFDGKTRRLFCARDHASVKPLYYFHGPGQFSFGSTLKQVLANPKVPRQLNEGMIAELLSCPVQSYTETIYAGVQRLPGGHYLLVEEGHLKVSRYWQISFDQRIRYSRPESYAEQFEEIFTEAVRCRMRSIGPVGTTLSGGKDSPLVAATAQSLLDQSDAKSPLKSFSITYPGRDCDESTLIKDVVTKWQLDASYYPAQAHGPTPDWAGQIAQTLDLPEFPVSSALFRAQQHSARSGCRVWLSGTGSGGLFSGSDFVSASLLRDRKIEAFGRELRHQVRHSGFSFAALHLGAGLCWPRLPHAVRARIQSNRHHLVHAGFITREFSRVSGIDSRFRMGLDASEFRELSQWSAYHSSFAGSRQFSNETHDLWNSVNGIEERHPFMDRRLAEFAFAVPDYINIGCGQEKLLILAMGKRLLPESVLANLNKPEAGRLFLDVMCRDSVRSIFETLQSADRGWVSKEHVLAVYNSLSQTYHANANARLGDYVRRDYARLMSLWMVLAVDLWLRYTKV